MREVEDAVVVAALAQLAREDPGLAENARVALHSLTADEGLDTITQCRLQEWLWHRLPVTFWTDPAPRPEIATALGMLLEIVGMPRYAELCRSTITREILTAYDRDEAAGRAAFHRTMAASGVAPPDVPELSWGGVMGVVEVGAYDTAASVLELAVSADALRPGSRGWRQVQQAVVRRHLLIPRPELDGDCWLDRVHAERVACWTDSRGDARRRLLAAHAETLLGPAEPIPDDAAQRVAPVRRLLERAVDGLPLTRTGRLRPATVMELALEFGWEDAGGPRRLEDDVPEVRAVRDLARGIRAVRRSGHRLVLTPAGRRLAGDDGALWQTLCTHLVAGSGFRAAAGELALALLLRGGADTGDEVSEAVADVIAAEGWREARSGEAPDARAVRYALVDLHWALELLALIGPAGQRWWTSPSWRLNAAGRGAALVALRARATRARRSAWEAV